MGKYYHETRKEAEAAAEQFAQYFTIKTELEPYNGWVIVLVPKSNDVFQWPLAPILELAEIEFPGRLSKRQPKRVPPRAESTSSRKKVVAPPPPPPPPPPGSAPAAKPKPVAPPPKPPKPPGMP